VDDDAQMPFGGVKASGYGNLGGMAAIHAITDLRWFTIAGQPGHFPN
jgi:acyl-CoA reductase-like NAD-dependent aldehyde dehydrogenase